MKSDAGSNPVLSSISTKENILRDKCTGRPRYISKEEAKKIIIKAVVDDKLSIPVLEMVLDHLLYGNNVVMD